MMNLELLEVVSKITSNPKYAKIARSHADVTMKHHFRADGGTYHVLNYDQRPGFEGSIQEIRRGQGLGCESAWSRGQSWAIYGYTMMYRETKNEEYLAFAQKVADFAINHKNMPADGIPYWDYGAPGEERDSSAGSIMASALVELSRYVPEAKGKKYREFAIKQLLTLASPAYFAEGDEVGHFLLKHGVGHKPAGGEIDVPLNYGDYYFLEALLRIKAL
jgi:rhamnogalacturonyl hydrolase YesR